MEMGRTGGTLPLKRLRISIKTIQLETCTWRSSAVAKKVPLQCLSGKNSKRLLHRANTHSPSHCKTGRCVQYARLFVLIRATRVIPVFPSNRGQHGDSPSSRAGWRCGKKAWEEHWIQSHTPHAAGRIMKLLC